MGLPFALKQALKIDIWIALQVQIYSCPLIFLTASKIHGQRTLKSITPTCLGKKKQSSTTLLYIIMVIFHANDSLVYKL